MIGAIEIPSDINLKLFSAFLHQVGVAHRITLEGVNQVVWVNASEDVQRVRHYYSQLTSGELVLEDQEGHRTGRLTVASRLFVNVWRYPLTMGIILISILFFPVTMNINAGGPGELFSQLTFLKFSIVAGNLYFEDLTSTLATGEYWRLLTPMLIHFGWMHIVFNLLWLWEIGRRIELIGGSSVLLLVTLFSSLCANFLQYAMAGPGLFGGMSGVVYGYLGYSLVWDKLVPTKLTGVRSGIYIFMLVFLVLGFTGFIDLLGMGSLANGAHLGGLLGGALIGLLAAMLQRIQTRQT